MAYLVGKDDESFAHISSTTFYTKKYFVPTVIIPLIMGKNSKINRYKYNPYEIFCYGIFYIKLRHVTTKFQ